MHLELYFVLFHMKVPGLQLQGYRQELLHQVPQSQNQLHMQQYHQEDIFRHLQQGLRRLPSLCQQHRRGGGYNDYSIIPEKCQ